MRVHCLYFCVLIFGFLANPTAATECANRVGGAAPSIEPNDTGDGEATACGASAEAGGSFSTALGYSASSGGLASAALGAHSESTGDYSMALGYEASSAGNSSSALGRSANSGGLASMALGYEATSAGNFSTALGYEATSDGTASMALGYEATSVGISSMALGVLAGSHGHYSGALGYYAFSSGEHSTALGAFAVADQPGTVILGAIAGINGAAAYANVGMGTSNPLEAVDVERSSAAARFQLTSFTGDATQAPQFIQRRARGTTAEPTAVQNSDNLGLFSFRGYNGSSMGGSRATITAQAAGTFSGSSTPTRLIFSTTPVGQTTPQSVLVITPDGRVQVKGQNLNVPDYVFEDDYPLMPLDELRSFIDENGHLPGIASAAQVNEEGLDLAGSQMSQLQKIEELTLYTLQQEGRLAQQDSRLAAQQAQIEELKTMLTQALAALD